MLGPAAGDLRGSGLAINRAESGSASQDWQRLVRLWSLGALTAILGLIVGFVLICVMSAGGGPTGLMILGLVLMVGGVGGVVCISKIREYESTYQEYLRLCEIRRHRPPLRPFDRPADDDKLDERLRPGE
jgi:hypothetical protein